MRENIDDADFNATSAAAAGAKLSSKLDYTQFLDNQQFQLVYNGPALSGAFDLLDFKMPGLEYEPTSVDVMHLNNMDFSVWQTNLTKTTSATKKDFVILNNATDPYKVPYTVKKDNSGSGREREVKCRPPYIIVVQS